MRQPLTIIDKFVANLLGPRHPGGTKKLEHWLLTSDKDFNAITAERYIINYLQQRNRGIVDNLLTDGVDAYLDCCGSTIGIEITTLNGFIADWILLERLTLLLDK